MIEPCERPSAFLPNGPFNNFPRTIQSFHMKSLGKSNEKHCRPVHLLSTVGGGNSAPSIHIIMLHMSALSNKTPSCVIIQEDNKVSCTIPMTGLLDCGVIMFFATAINSCASALDSCVCNACKFISSPSKSALYGVVQLKFKRNVFPIDIIFAL